MDERVVTIDEAVLITGLSRRALEGRIARKTLAAEKRGGRLFIRVRDLCRLNLVRPDSGGREEYVISELLDRLEMLAAEIERLRAELALREGC